ncbi:unnamed protein product [Mytilus coruscus]|uniref:Uncharacterized protein n=1 Tax=Mytilus coruscus TaxID=42192 RepID=A0A6J8AHR1_MYTCO|nr:unnamed protein product [Mytilus coruscus]
MKISLQISQTPVRNMLNTPRSSNVSHINTPSTSGINTPSTSGVGSRGPCRSESSTPNARSVNTSSNDIHSLGHRDLSIRIYERQEEILQRLKAQAAHDNSSAKSKEYLVVPIGVKAHMLYTQYIHLTSMYTSVFHFRVSDAVNKNMTSHIVTFVKGWNPAYNDITVLNCAMARYFLTKKQQQSAINKNKYEGEKRERALYERKKEVCIIIYNLLSQKKAGP